MPHSRSHRKRRKQTPQQVARTRKRHLLLLLTFTLVAYLSVLPAGFVWHDANDLVGGDYRLTGFSDLGDALTLPANRYRERFDGASPDLNSGSWQPVTILSNTLSWAIWGECSSCWHAENLLLHFLVVIGLYALGRHLLAHRRHGNGMAFWAAALFAVHPGTVSSVASLGGRSVLLAAAFGILALGLFSRLQPTTNVPRKHVQRWMYGGSLAALMAMLSHESSYLLPLAAFLIALLAAQERGRGNFRGIAPVRWRALGFFTLALLLVLVFRQLFVGGLHFAGGYPTDSLFNNLGTALRHFWYLVEQTLLPHEPVISDAWEISYGWDAGEVAALLGTLVVVGATLVGLALGHPSAFGGAWFLLWLAPGVGILPAQHYHNDQFLYLAVWGLAFSFVYAVTQAWRPISRQLVRGSEAIVFTPILITLMVISGFSNARWWDHERLFESEISNDPHYIEGRIQLANHALDNGRPVDALNHVLTAIEARESRKFTGYWDAAETYRLLGKIQLNMALYADAVNSLERAVEERPQSASSQHLLGQALLHIKDYKQAETSLRKAAAIRPTAEVSADLGVALLGLEESDEGVSLLTQALQTAGIGNFLRHSALGLHLVEQEEYAAARKQLQESLSFRETANTRAALALAQWNLGEREMAYENLSIAMQIDEEHNPYVERINETINGHKSLLFGN